MTGLATALAVYMAVWPVEARAGQPLSVEARIASAWPGDDRKAVRVARCESNLNPRAISKSGKYRGLFQFDRVTWASHGGKGDPAQASVQEQTARTWQASKQGRSWSRWPVCGKR